MRVSQFLQCYYYMWINLCEIRSLNREFSVMLIFHFYTWLLKQFYVWRRTLYFWFQSWKLSFLGIILAGDNTFLRIISSLRTNKWLNRILRPICIVFYCLCSVLCLIIKFIFNINYFFLQKYTYNIILLPVLAQF